MSASSAAHPWQVRTGKGLFLVDSQRERRYNYLTPFAERCRSGRTGTTGNRVGAYRLSRVRIPLSPPSSVTSAPSFVHLASFKVRLGAPRSSFVPMPTDELQGSGCVLSRTVNKHSPLSANPSPMTGGTTIIQGFPGYIPTQGFLPGGTSGFRQEHRNEL